MLLTLAVLFGFLAGSLRAILQGKSIQVPELKHSWIVFAALIPQILAFQIAATGRMIPLSWAKVILIGSQFLLLGFVWVNRQHRGLLLLGLGLGMNLLVILLNGGLMPIQPENASYVHPSVAPQDWILGRRLGLGKDIVLIKEDTQLEILSDRFRLPDLTPIRAAFSLGDVIISLGILQLLWNIGQSPKNKPVPQPS